MYFGESGGLLVSPTTVVAGSGFLVRFFHREIADRAAELHMRRSVPPLARLGEPRQTDLVDLGELFGRQQARCGRGITRRFGRRVQGGDLRFRAVRPSLAAVTPRRYSALQHPSRASIRNWSSLGTTAISGSAVIQGRNVLAPQSAGRRSKRGDIDIAWNTPMRVGSQCRL